MASQIVGVVLAAGRATRFGGGKLLAPLRVDVTGAPVATATTVGAASCAAMHAALARTVAVVRAGDEPLARVLRATGVETIECRRADEGMGASLACGVQATSDAQGWVIGLADMPWITAATIARVRDAIARGAIVAAPYCGHRRGHPVGFAASCFDELSALGGDDGARAVVLAHATELERIDVDDAGVLRDIDTVADLR